MNERERLRKMAQEALSEFFDSFLEQVKNKKEEGTNVESRLSEAELERYELASTLFDDLLGTSTVEALEEAAGKPQGEPVEEAQEQAQEGKATRTVEVPILERDRVHGLSVVGYRSRSVEVENKDDDLTEEEKAKLVAYDALLNAILGGM